jgi:hypothetical protein
VVCNHSCSEPAVDSETLPSGSRVEKEIEEGNADDEGGVRKERERRRGQRARSGRKIVRAAIKRAHRAV